MNETCTCAMTGPDKCKYSRHRVYAAPAGGLEERYDHGVGPAPHTWIARDAKVSPVPPLRETRELP